MVIMDKTVLRNVKIRVSDVTISMVCVSLGVSQVGWGNVVNQVLYIMFIVKEIYEILC